MIQADQSGGHSDRPGDRALYRLVAHYRGISGVVAAGVFVATLLIPGHPIWAATVGMALTAIEHLMVTRHDRVHCPGCADRIPENPEKLVRRHKWIHFRGPVLLYCGVGVAAPVVIFTLAEFIGLGWMRLIIVVPMFAALYVRNILYKHTLIVVWCPWCRDDGPREPSSEPTPDPHETATS